MLECEVLTKDGYKTEYAYEPSEFDFKKLKAKAYRQSKYIQKPMTFDIETSRIFKEKHNGTDRYQAFMYLWQVCIEGMVVIGRTWQEFITFLENLEQHYNLHPKRRLVIYVHNLSYEFQFMKSFINFVDVFAMDTHEILTCRTDCFEFRCSYLLSNMSLAKFIKNTPNTYHLKGEGDLDYTVLRTPSTVLKPKELGYAYNDVMGLYEAICEMLKSDTLQTIKLTSTGFVRRDCRNAMRKNKKNRKKFQQSALDLPLYRLAKECFRGGNTASNRYHTNMVVENVGSWDISSSYPFCMVAFKYPSGTFMEATILDNTKKLHEYNKEYCTMGRYIFTNLRVKRKSPIPYIPISKVLAYTGVEPGDIYNGRVMQAERLVIALTNIDFEVVESVYDFDKVEVIDFYYAYADYLPQELIDTIFSYFRAKSELKGVEGKEYEYMKAKNKLNGIYGMCVTDMLHPNYEYVDGELVEEVYTEDKKKELLEKYYKSRNNFLSYQWGVWVTAYARRQLQIALNKVGIDVVYCDTDSVKYVGDHDKDFEAINNGIRKYCEENNRIHSVDVNGKHFEIGTYDKELTKTGGVYNKFKTLGAKKYCFEINGEIGLTLAGCSKKGGAKELQEGNGIDDFRIGKVFYNAGRSDAQYNEEPPHIIDVNGEKIITGSNIAIVDVTYTLGMTEVMLGILDNLL